MALACAHCNEPEYLTDVNLLQSRKAGVFYHPLLGSIPPFFRRGSDLGYSQSWFSEAAWRLAACWVSRAASESPKALMAALSRSCTPSLL